MADARAVQEKNRVRVQFEQGLTKRGRPACRSISIPMLSPDVPEEAIRTMIEAMRAVMGYTITGAEKIEERVGRVWGPEMRVREDEEEETLSGLERKRRMAQDATVAVSTAQDMSVSFSAQSAVLAAQAAPLMEQMVDQKIDVFALPAHVKAAILRDRPMSDGTLYSRAETGMSLSEFIKARRVLKSRAEAFAEKEAAKAQAEAIRRWAKARQEAKAAQRAEMKRKLTGEKEKVDAGIEREKGAAPERIIAQNGRVIVENPAASEYVACVVTQEEKGIPGSDAHLRAESAMPPRPVRKKSLFGKIRDFLIDDSYLIEAAPQKNASVVCVQNKETAQSAQAGQEPALRFRNSYTVMRRPVSQTAEAETAHDEQAFTAPVLHCEEGG